MKETIEYLTSEAVTLLKEMIAIPSPSFEEDAVCTHICEHLQEKGANPQRVGNNIVCEMVTDPLKPVLMLCAHMDTVSAASGYSFDPYRPDYGKAALVTGLAVGKSVGEDEIVAGLGSNDDGASVVAMISVFRYFLKHPERSGVPNLTLVLTSEEERSGAGGMRSLWEKRLSQIKYAIVGEPTGMKVATSERGLLVIDAVCEGVSGHAARNEGVNAIYKAMEDIGRLRSHKFPKTSPLMGDVHLNITQINAGTAHNVVPDKCSFVVDIRPTEQYSNEEIFNELQEICSGRLTARNLANRSSATCNDSPLLAAAEACGMATFSSPTTSDWMRIRCDAVKMGPGDSSRSHRKDEFVFVGEIRDAIEKYIEFIGKISL
ncbi:MAG: M20/M25/M40 family metallo-hydrolase [Candidatus Cryptobacteroides sp.]